MADSIWQRAGFIKLFVQQFAMISRLAAGHSQLSAMEHEPEPGPVGSAGERGGQDTPTQDHSWRKRARQATGYLRMALTHAAHRGTVLGCLTACRRTSPGRASAKS